VARLVFKDCRLLICDKKRLYCLNTYKESSLLLLTCLHIISIICLHALDCSLRDCPLSLFKAAKLGHSDLIPFNIPLLTLLLIEERGRCSLNSREGSVSLYQKICTHALSHGRKGIFAGALLKIACTMLRVLDIRK